MKPNNKKKNTVKNNSSGGHSKELLKTLQKIIFEETGSVQFVVVDQRIRNVHSTKPKEIEVKSIQNLNLSKESIQGKSPNDLVYMFESIKHDLGAKYWVAS